MLLFIPKYANTLPLNDIPKHSHPNMKAYWMAGDAEEYYNKQKHPLYGPTDIIYEHNSYGYRCPEFKQVHDCIISIGCSYVYGIGLPQGDLYHEIVTDRLSNATGRKFTNWNLGMEGRSNDYIARTLLLAMPILKPKLCLINFTGFSRREFMDHTGTLTCYGPWSSIYYKGTSKILCEHLDNISNEHDDILNFYKNYKIIEMVLKLHNVEWVFSTMTKEIRKALQFTDQSRYLGQLQCIDMGRDHHHPGRNSHLKMADTIWSHLQCILSKL